MTERPLGYYETVLGPVCAGCLLPLEACTCEARTVSDVEQCWRDVWAPIVAPDGEVDLEQIKRELYDYAVVLNEVPKVYDHVTGGALSKSNTVASAIIDAADRYYAGFYEGDAV